MSLNWQKLTKKEGILKIQTARVFCGNVHEGIRKD